MYLDWTSASTRLKSLLIHKPPAKKWDESRLKIAFQHLLICSSPFSAFLCFLFWSPVFFSYPCYGSLRGKCLFHRFTKMYFKHVLFEDTFFDECYFEDVTSTDTYFKNCTIESTIFYNTGEHRDRVG